MPEGPAELWRFEAGCLMHRLYPFGVIARLGCGGCSGFGGLNVIGVPRRMRDRIEAGLRRWMGCSVQ